MRLTYKRFLCFMMAGVLTASLATACGAKSEPKNETNVTKDTKGTEQKEEPENLPVVRAAIMPYLNSVPVNYIKDKGLDEKNGFKLETVPFTTGAPMNEAISTDAYDVGVMSTATVYSLATYGAYLIADFGDSAGGTGIYVRPDSDIAGASGYNPTYPDLMGDPDSVRGKQIIYQTGHVSHMTSLKWLEKIGVNADEVDIVNMEQASAYQAFLAGEGDAVALAPPFSYNAEEQGWICVADLNNMDVPQREAVIATPKAYKEKHDLLVAFTRALFEANEALRADPEMEAQLLAEWYKENGSETAEAVVKKEVETRPLLTAKEACSEELGAATRLNAEFFVELGTLEVSKLPVYDTNIVTDILEEAIGYGK